ncbi:MAG: hypothetical protein M3P12_08645 [Gemmatimonadota bacterium]|nr:hypothetical protein [Gemmatimonadota bacterium]
MPHNKDLKRLVRARMKKTGEAYTAARANIITKPKATPATKAVSLFTARATFAAGPKPADYATVAGMSDEKLKAQTGCTWERWVYALDRRGAEKMSHRDIAALVNEKYKINGWWSQTVTVGYERIKGLRARGQRRDGTYEANKSRTFNVPVATLFAAWADESVRRRWLNGEKVKVRTATAPKSMRLGWSDGRIVAVGFAAKGKSKSSVALSHPKLADKATADRLKQYWSDRLDSLGQLLAGRQS